MPDRSAPAARVSGVALAAAAGLLIGALGSFKYRYGLTRATPLPIGLVLVLLMIGLVLVALRAATGRRLYGVAAAVGVVATVALFSLKGPGGSVVVVGDAWGTAWTVAPALIAAVALGAPSPWRRAARRSRPTSCCRPTRSACSRWPRTPTIPPSSGLSPNGAGLPSASTGSPATKNAGISS